MKLRCDNENGSQKKQYFIPPGGKVPFGNGRYVFENFHPPKECILFSIEQAEDLNQCLGRPGGQNKRNSLQMYINTQQGKIAEEVVKQHLAILKFFCSNIDYRRTERGQGDNSDLIIANNDKSYSVQVKSSLSYSNLLLLEKANIKPVFCSYNVLAFVRMEPSIKEIMKENNITNKNFEKNENSEKNKDEIVKIIGKTNFKVEITGYTNRGHLRQIINEKQLISQGDTLNGTPMDADNYYILAKDLRKIKNPAPLENPSIKPDHLKNLPI